MLEPVRIMLRPLLIMPEQHRLPASRLHARSIDALEAAAPSSTLQRPRRAEAAAASRPTRTPGSRDVWAQHRPRAPNPLYGRLDAVCDFTSARWQDSLQFMEPNLSGVGGIHMGPLAETLVMRDVVPTILAHDPSLRLELPRDQRDLFLQVLLDHASAIGRPGAQPSA